MTQRYYCEHCEQDRDAIDRQAGPCPGCEELGHEGEKAKSCPACRADSRQPAGKPGKSPKTSPATKKGRIQPAEASASKKQTLLSTLAGLKSIAGEAYAQKTAEDLLLAFLDDAEIAAAYAPFARSGK